MISSCLLSALVALTSASHFHGARAQAAPAAPAAQAPQIEFPQPSPLSTLKQRVGLTDIEVVYSRPSAKGRVIFGGLVPYGEVWRTGANAATKLTFSTPVRFGGAAVPAGSYALFTLPGASEWTVMLNQVTGDWATHKYDAKNDLVSLKIASSALMDAVETMTIDVNELRPDAANLAISWVKTRVSVPIEVDVIPTLLPKIQAAMAAAGPKPYFRAAMFYYEYGLDLKQASAWIEEAVKEAPEKMHLHHYKAQILAKAGDKAGAIAAANVSLELALKAGGPQGAEYKRKNEALLATLKSQP